MRQRTSLAPLKVIDHQGLTVHVDRPAGTTWSGTDPDGQPYTVTQQDDYGFFPGVKGDDGEDYDAYIGPSPQAASVHVVTQRKAKTGAYDEQKAMLGYDSAAHAEAVYRAHTHPKMFGGIASLPTADFKAQIEAHRGSETKAPFRAVTTETKDMTDASLQTRDAGAGAAAAPGSAAPRPHGLCVREAGLSAVREEDREVDFVCSTDSLDSYNECVLQNWNLTRFARNPVALWAHDSRALPIGQWLNVRVEDGALKGTLKVATAAANPLAEQVWQSIREQTLRAVSVGFVPHSVKWETENDHDYCVLDDNELYEISVTPLPANPDALAEEKRRAKDAFFAARGAVAYEAHPPQDPGKWDGANAEKRVRKWASSDGSGSADHIDWNKYRAAFAWVDPKQSHQFAGYKLPHHDIAGGKLITHRGGVIAAGDALVGSRGGVKIPEGDVTAVKSHLAKHYHQFDLKAPWEDPGENKTSAPRGPSTEKRMSKDMVTCPHCGEDFDPDDDDGDEKSKAAKATARKYAERHVAKATEAQATKLTATHTAQLAERDAALTARDATIGTLSRQLREAELLPLSGVKFVPAQLAGQLDLAAHYATQGEAGTKKWADHLASLKAAPDLKILGGSVVDADPTPSGLTSASANGGDELAGVVNQLARPAA